MTALTVFVSGDPGRARATIDQIFSLRGFAVQYQDPFNGLAERGSKGATIAFGALAGGDSQHLRVRFSFAADPYGNTAITLASDTTGAAAGLIGVNRANKAYAELFGIVRTAFLNACVLVGEQAY